MTQPSRPLVPPTPLTFEELRLANLVHPHSSAEFRMGFSAFKKLDDVSLAAALAEVVIHTDWLAASRGIDLVLAIRNAFATEDPQHDVGREKLDDPLTFDELRLASKLHKLNTKQAMAQLTELAQNFPPQTLERFMDGEPINAHMRLVRQHGGYGLLVQTLADIVIHIDRFAAMNDIDLAAAIRQRFEPTGDPQHDVEGKRPGT